MVADFFDYFYKKEFDKTIIIKDKEKYLTAGEIKGFVYNQVQYLKTLGQNIVFDIGDNLDFIINFLACIFAEKNIYIRNTNKKEEVQKGFEIIKEINPKIYEASKNNIIFDKINPEEIFINICTSGTSSNQKIISKNFDRYLKESRCLKNTFTYNNPLEFVSSTTMNHIFGLCFYFILPMCTGSIINTKKINYPEDLGEKNFVLITSPSFLSFMKKYNCSPKNKLEKIFSAGAKLEDDVFNYANKISKETIDIYGSTETATIAYRLNPNEDLTLLDGVKIEAKDNITILKSPYSAKDEDELSDLIEVKENGKIQMIGRRDRIFKIQEKRVSAEELEEKISKNELVEESYCIKTDNKIGALISLSQKGIERAIKEGNLASIIIELKNELSKDFKIIPQVWKFIDIIPKTKSGKFDKEKINGIFNLNLSLPLVIKRKVSENNAEFELFFHKNCNFYKGHFENFPITAGVVQLFYADYFTRLAFGIDCHIGQLKRIKFKNMLCPDKIVTLNLTKNEKQVEYSYTNKDEQFSEGCLPVINMLKETK